MLKAVVLCTLVFLAAGQEDDDGQYHPERYEVPYQGETNSVSQGYRRPQAYSQPSYQSDPRNAAILSEARYLTNDGKFGASYTQEDGVEFKEESEPDGTRRGEYSWVDPSGQRRKVTYTAGKHGFHATGDHLPTANAAAAPQPQPQPQPRPQYRPQPQYQAEPQYQDPEPQYRPQPQAQPQYRPQPQAQPQYRPQPQAQPQPQYRPQPQAQPQYRPQPQYRAQAAQPAPPLVGGHPDVSPQSAGGYSISSTF